MAKAVSATALKLSAATVIQGSEQTEKISVRVSSAGAPTGQAAVTAGATLLCKITLVSSAGSCALRAAQLPPGSYRVTASYSGDGNTSLSVSPARALTVAQRPTAFTIIPSDNYAGWSVHPPDGTARSVRAQWKVPKITCGRRLSRTWNHSRAGVWAGMWGPLSGLSTTDWLPQAGTVSQCFLGHVSYHAFYELAAAKGGNGATILMPVAPGDTIHALIAYIGTNSAKQLIFSYSITDVTQHHKNASGQMPPTPKGVRLSAATYQGGVVVEDEPAGVGVGGLSRFASPISVAEPFTTVNGAGLQTYSGFDTLYRWNLISSANPKKKLADTGAITSKGFSVSWLDFF